MPFIEIVNPPAQTLTKAQLLTRDTTAMKAQGAHLLAQLKAYADKSLATVWQNEAYTPQEFLTKLGTTAASAMQQHGQLIVYLAGQGVSVDTSMVKAYVINGDGSVTVAGE